MHIFTTRAQLDAYLGAAPGSNICVPTMGALHEGHAALVRAGASEAQRRGLPRGCVVTIFVNPTQFNEKTDFDRYPRTLEADAALCAAAGAAAVFAPSPAEVYPLDRPVPVPELPLVATRPGLEDAQRPGHFAGVCQVVARLFELVRPAAAVFGEKDWQQLQVVRAMTRALGLPIEILPHATVREAGGLAMSSRNRFIAPEHRAAALRVSAALAAAREHRDPARAEHAMRAVLGAEAQLRTEYAVVRDAESLLAWAPGRPGRALVAARLGAVRLIDNQSWG